MRMRKSLWMLLGASVLLIGAKANPADGPR